MSVLTSLRDLIERYTQAKGKSRVTLAKESGISYGAINNLMQMEVDPTFDTIFALTKVMLSQEELALFIQTHYPYMADIFKIDLPSVSNSNNYRHAFSSEIKLKILCLASLSEGTDVNQVTFELGQEGLRNLTELLEAGSLREINNRIKCSNDLVLDFNDLASAFKQSIDLMQKGSKNHDFYHLGWHTEGLNQKGWEKLITILREAEKKISELKNDPTYRGTISVIMGTLASIVFLKDAFKKGDN